MITKPLISSDAEIARYMSIPYAAPLFDIGNIRALYESAGDRALLMVAYSEPMYAVASLFDFEDFSVRCITDLEKLLQFIDWAYERSHENLRLLLEACSGMKLLFHTSGPEICCPPMLNPGLFPKLVTPYTARLIELIHAHGQLAGIHCHGRVREVFLEMVRTGTDLLEPIEPPPQGNIGLSELMTQAGGRLCLMGHIQDQELYTAKPGEMRAKVQEIARVVNGRTGYIMSPTCTPFEHPCSATYRRNYLEWLDAAEELLA